MYGLWNLDGYLAQLQYVTTGLITDPKPIFLQRCHRKSSDTAQISRRLNLLHAARFCFGVQHSFQDLQETWIR